MAGAGYKLFNTGDVLTAAQVNTYLQEQTVMVFASAAARTTALSGVVSEGMMSYLTDTDVIQYYNGTSWVTVNTDQTPLTTKGDLFTFSTVDARLGVGSNGQVLTADSTQATGLKWATPSSGGGLTLLATATPSAAASFSFTSISGSYKNLLMYWQDFSTSAGGIFATMKLNNDSGANYEFQTLRIKSQTTNIAVDAADGSSQTSMMGGTSQNQAFAGMFAGSATQTVGRGWLRIWNYTNTTYTFYDWHSKSYDNTVPNQIQTFGWGGYDNSAAITRIDVTTNTGTFSGTCYLYGEA